MHLPDVYEVMEQRGCDFDTAVKIVKGEISPDTDPIYVTHEQDSSLEADELIIHTTIDKKDTK